MKLPILSVLSIGLLFNSCAQTPQIKERKQVVDQITAQFELQDFLKDQKELDAAVDKVFARLDDTAIVAQLIMPAVGRFGQEKATIDQHIKNRIIGGVLMLNGTKEALPLGSKILNSKMKITATFLFCIAQMLNPVL